MKLYRSLHISCYVLVFAITILFAGCGRQHKFRVGIAQCSSDDWRNKMNEEILREVMLHDNVEVEIRSADDDSEKQIADLDYFVSNGFDLIAVAPNEADALTPKIRQIYESGTPVIVYDRNINGDYFTAFQGADNEEIGSMAASYVAALTDAHPDIIEIRGLAGSSPAEGRHAGFRHTADSLGYTILAEAYGNWIFEDARDAVDSLLAIYPSTNVIYAHNDRMALGAREVTEKRGRTDIKIIGVDAAPQIGIKAVSEKKIDATFLYPTAGHQLMKTALAILQGEPYDRKVLLRTPAPVDSSNAEILLLQDSALRDETSKISALQGKVLDFSQKFAIQSNMLYAAVAIILLFAILTFVLLRFYWNSKRHHRQMAKRNEELARQRDELDNLYRQLQEATGSKLTFFTNVSHDLRTPLTLIADPVEQLACADNLTPKQHTLMQLANKNVKRLQRLINQILDIRKYDSGQLKLNLVNVNLSETLLDWVAPFAGMAAKRHIKFNTKIPQTPQVITAIDVEKCERILFNLLSNAFKFTAENGSITVSLRCDDNDAVISVADTGIGIPAQELNNVFERFFKTDRINPNGSGIGLALSKVFIDMHGGSIAVSSDEGAGTVFTVRLPLRKVETKPAEEAKAQVETKTPAEAKADEEIKAGEEAKAPEISSESVAIVHVEPSHIDVSELDVVEDESPDIAEDTPILLIIDDNKDICTLVKSILADSYTVLTAYSGPQGIRLANKYIPDLIVCDVMMPGMNGYEVCAALKNDPLTSHIPVLLLTACSRDEQRVEGYECGADAFMTKPFDSAMLLARCSSLIENRNRIYSNPDIFRTPEANRNQQANRNPSGSRNNMEENHNQDSVRNSMEGSRNLQAVRNSIEDEFIVRFRDIVEREISNSELSVEFIADEMGLSRVQLYRKIKALTNCSAVELIRNVRLKRAATMLKTSDRTVSEIAYAVGFSSPGYFSKCYKDYFNESPGDTQRRTSKAR